MILEISIVVKNGLTLLLVIHTGKSINYGFTKYDLFLFLFLFAEERRCAVFLISETETETTQMSKP